jgi:hypothetical protein
LRALDKFLESRGIDPLKVSQVEEVEEALWGLQARCQRVEGERNRLAEEE